MQMLSRLLLLPWNQQWTLEVGEAGAAAAAGDSGRLVEDKGGKMEKSKKYLRI